MKHTFLSALFVGFLFFLFAGSAFAQDAATNDQAVAQMATVPAADLSAPENDWQKQSKLYKGLGWGFFGGGLALVIAGPIIAVTSGLSNATEGDADGVAGGAIAGWAVAALGGAMFTTSIGLLIAEAVKFGPYRRGEIAGLEFDWRPEIYTSPEFSGLGFSARF